MMMLCLRKKNIYFFKYYLWYYFKVRIRCCCCYFFFNRKNKIKGQLYHRVRICQTTTKYTHKWELNQTFSKKNGWTTIYKYTHIWLFMTKRSSKIDICALIIMFSSSCWCRCLNVINISMMLFNQVGFCLLILSR